MTARLAALFVALATTATAATIPSPASLPPASSPAAAITRLAAVYEAKSVPGMDELLTADFHWHYAADDSITRRYALGWGRDLEMRFARNLFVGGGRPDFPPPQRLVADPGKLEVGVDPEHPDSTCQYRLVVSPYFSLTCFLPNGDTVLTFPHLEVFHVVRGDVAVRMPGQSADSTHWYLRRWIEDVDALTLSLQKIDGECGGDDAPEPIVTAMRGSLCLRAIGAPLCPTLKVLCDLPGSEPAQLEVYDLQGRRLAQRSLLPGGSASRLVEAGSGERFTPGAYWVRLSQGRRPPVTRMVMVAR